MNVSINRVRYMQECFRRLAEMAEREFEQGKTVSLDEITDRE